MSLFYSDTAEVLDAVGLREAARIEVARSSLIQRAAAGDKPAAEALHKGFWPFVHDFEDAIDQHVLARGPLREKFGFAVADRVFLGLARAVREMKLEEGSHALHWRKDASSLGIDSLDAPLIDGVRDLVVQAYTPNHTLFFSVLAGTEFIAEELSAFLVNASPFTGLFPQRRWAWGDVHLLPHDHGPSHLDIDLDLARAYAPIELRPSDISEAVRSTIRLFGTAARQVEEQLTSR